MPITFRREEEQDRRAVEHLVREAFWNVYRPGCLEHLYCTACAATRILCRSWTSSWKRMVA